jgi:outer membrane protein OmpA-like peptidoglycan-associated protein
MWQVGLPVTLTLGILGCATKKYVRQQVDPVSHQVTALEAQTNEKIAAVSTKQQSDISQVNERISSTDLKVSQNADAAQQAQGTASRALQQSDANSGRIDANSAAVSALASGVASALNYQLVEKADVTFGFDQYSLTPEARAVLNRLAVTIQGLPRAMVEVTGFTDKRGTPIYNLALSRRRAEVVERYLVTRKVPLHQIHMIGLGEEEPPPGLEAVLNASDPNPTKEDVDRLARRVQIRIFGAGEITQGSASRAQKQSAPRQLQQR